MNKSMQEFFLATILTILIYFTAANIIPFLLILFPLNFIILGLRRSLAYSGLSLLVSLAFVYILSGPGAVIAMALLSLVGLPIVLGAKRGLEANKTIGLASLLLLIALGLVFFLADHHLDEGLMTSMEELIIQSANEQYEALDEAGFFMGLDVTARDMKKATEELINLMIIALPAIMATYSFFISLVNYYLAGRILRSSQPSQEVTPYKLGRFRFFRLPEDFNEGVLYCLVGVLILRLIDFSYVRELIINLVLLGNIAYLFQGMAVVADIVGSRSGALAALVNALLLTSGLSIILTILGILEGFLHIRLRWRKRNG